MLVRAYLDMLRLELSGQAYTKAEYRRQVGQLIERSEGSIEYKLQNVSSALYEINHPFIDGYKPARNLQDALRQEVHRQLDMADDIALLAFGALQRGAELLKVDLAWSIEDPPHIEVRPSPSSTRRARRVDSCALRQRTIDWGRPVRLLCFSASAARSSAGAGQTSQGKWNT